MDIDKIYNEDCLEGMKRIPDGSIDMILCDLPYGTTCDPWDTMIPLNELWEQYKRIIKKNGAICLWAQIPFSIKLGASNLSMLRYEWVLEKSRPTGFFNAKRMPLKAHENVLVFYKSLPTYNPQPLKYGHHKIPGKHRCAYPSVYMAGHYAYVKKDSEYDFYYPRDVLKMKSPQISRASGKHPTQKPVSACEYFIKTYTNEGELILDNCMGSGTTAVACINTNRHFLGFELEKEYFELACKRIANAKAEKESKFAFC